MAVPTIDIFDLWIALRNNVNTQQGGFIRPQQNFQSWVNEISMELFNDKISNLGRGQKINDELAVFVKTVNGVLTPQSGRNYDLLVYPGDYAYFSSARFLISEQTKCGCIIEGNDFVEGKNGKCSNYTDPQYKEIADSKRGSDLCEIAVTMVPNQMWGSACDNSFKKPTWNQPIMTQFEGGFKVMPRGLGIIILDYLKVPRKAVFGYTLGPDDNIIYDANASVQLEWPESMKGEFLARLQKRYGMYVREEFVYQASEQERQINK